MDRAAFREALLGVMEQKDHWAWPAFGNGLVPKERFHIHLEQEYEVYVRDFPILVARAYVQCPIAEVRRELIENVYEEETGGLVAGRPHPELFLEVPRGLGMDLTRFERITLLPKAKAYRALLDDCTEDRGWAVAAAVSTLWVEGTRYERGELRSRRRRRCHGVHIRRRVAVHRHHATRCVEKVLQQSAHRTAASAARAATLRPLASSANDSRHRGH